MGEDVVCLEWVGEGVVGWGLIFSIVKRRAFCCFLDGSIVHLPELGWVLVLSIAKWLPFRCAFN